MVEETFEPDVTVRLVAHHQGVAPNSCFPLAAVAAGSGEDMAPWGVNPVNPEKLARSAHALSEFTR